MAVFDFVPDGERNADEFLFKNKRKKRISNLKIGGAGRGTAPRPPQLQLGNGSVYRVFTGFSSFQMIDSSCQ